MTFHALLQARKVKRSLIANKTNVDVQVVLQKTFRLPRARDKRSFVRKHAGATIICIKKELQRRIALNFAARVERCLDENILCASAKCAHIGNLRSWSTFKQRGTQTVNNT